MTTDTPQPERQNRATLVGTDRYARFFGMLLVNGLLGCALIALYLLLVTVLPLFGLAPAAHMLATIIVAVVLLPLRRRLERFSKLLLQREWQDSHSLVREVGEALSRTIDPEALFPLLADDLPRRLRLQGATLWMLEPPDDRVFVALGVDPALPGATILAQGVSAAQADYAGSFLLIPQTAESEWAPPFCMRAVHLVIPLRIGRRLVGIYGCGAPLRGQHYPPHVLNVLLTLAPAISGSIENARAYSVIARLNRQLRTLDQLKDEFIESVGHELRTPLTSLSLATQMIAGKPELAGELVGMLRENVARLQTLIDRVLSLKTTGSFADQSAGSATIELAPLLEDVITVFLPVAQTKGLYFTLEVPQALAAWGDAARLRRALHEIIDNAVRYSSAGTIALSASLLEGLAVIAITDQGVGIPAGEEPLLFAAFYRGSRMRALSGTPGAGIGLSIAQREIEALGGRVWLEQSSTNGSTICLSLPAVYLEENNEHHKEPHARAVGESK